MNWGDKKSLLRLNNPMDQNISIEVTLRSLEEVQIFLLASLEENRELAEVNLIDQALIKLSYTGGFYCSEKLHLQSYLEMI